MNACRPMLDDGKTADLMRGLVVIREDRVLTGKCIMLTEHHIQRVKTKRTRIFANT
jgi:hypothetical protein